MATAPSAGFQVRYVAYAVDAGRSPADQLAHDRLTRPGGHMAPFMGWVDARWREWKAETDWDGWTITDADHAAFDAWLIARAIDRGAIRALLRPCPTCGSPTGERCRTLPEPGVPSVPTASHKARRT